MNQGSGQGDFLLHAFGETTDCLVPLVPHTEHFEKIFDIFFGG